MELSQLFANYPFKGKIILVSLLSSLLALSLMGGFMVYYDSRVSKEELFDKIQVQARVLAENSVAELRFDDVEFAYTTLKSVAADPQISYVALYKLPGSPLFAAYQNPDAGREGRPPPEAPAWQGLREEEGYFLLSEPVLLKREPIGVVLIRTELTLMHQRLYQRGLIVFVTFLVTAVLAALIASWLRSWVTRPIDALLRVARDVADTNDYSLRAKREGRDELGFLVDSFNHMLSEIETSSNKRIEAETALQQHRDLLEQQVAEQTVELRRAKEVAEHSSEAKSRFLANMSHEIRTPMNAIIGMSELALGSELNPRQHNFITKVHHSAKLLLGILNDILDFSKIEANRLDLEETDFLLRSVLDNLDNLIGYRAVEKGLSLDVELDPDIPPVLRGDPLRLGQILLNLGNNAIKFTHQGGVLITWHLRDKETHRVTLEVVVADTGIGISTDKQARLFQPFVQAESSVSREYGGTGLGLAICDHLVKLMGGEIWVESEPGQGSRFHLTLTLGIGDEKNLEQAQVDSRESARRLRGARVLLVEDNRLNQELASELLTSHGMRVEVVGNGQEALEILQQQRFDVVLMDIQMPVMDGYTATREIRKQEALRGLPIIAMSANVMSRAREQAREGGMNDFIGKPLDVNRMLNTMAPLVQVSDPPAHQEQDPDSSATEVEDAGKDFSGLSGIDHLLGLSICADNRRLYLELLSLYPESITRFEDEYRDAYERRNRDDATRAAHTLKGASATIGAATIQEMANELELACKHNAAWSEIDQIATKLYEQLSATLQSLESFLASE